MNLVNFDNKDG